MRRWMEMALAVGIAGCAAHRPADLPASYRGRTLYTCCNLHHDGTRVSEANFHAGQRLAVGTPVRIEGGGDGSVTFSAGDKRYTLEHSSGGRAESLRQYVDKVFVERNPRQRLLASPESVAAAIREARVEVGMTREQVLMSLGYPPARRTPSLEATEWAYWAKRDVTYRVRFGADGRVAAVLGEGAPTTRRAVDDADDPGPPPVRRMPPPPRRFM